MNLANHTQEVPQNLQASATNENTTLINIGKSKVVPDIIIATNSKSEEEPTPSFFQLFRYATRLDWFFMITGSIAALANGTIMAVYSLIMGDMTDNFAGGPQTIVQLMTTSSLYMTYLGLGALVLSYIQMAFWMMAGERQAIEQRKEYFKALLSQEVGWHDSINCNELSTKLATETFTIQNAIGEKIPNYFMNLSFFLAGIVIAFQKGWQLALILLASMPILVVAGYLINYATQSIYQKTEESYVHAGGLAEQAISSIKTVKSLCGEEFETNNYANLIEKAKEIVGKYNIYLALGNGLINFFILAFFAQGYLFGSILIYRNIINSTTGKIYTTGDVFSVLFSMIFSGLGLGSLGPTQKAFTLAKEAAGKIFQVVDRKPTILLSDPSKKIVNILEGEITFNDVTFSFPNKKENIVLQNISFTIPKNKKIGNYA